MATASATAGTGTGAGGAQTTTTTTTTTTKKRNSIRHSLKQQQYFDPEIASVFQTLDHDLVRRQLDRALALALEAVGFDECDPLAMESFRALVEEYMQHFLRSVHRSMISARRTRPTPLDFQMAISDNNLTLRSLLPHLDPPVYDSSTPRHPLLSSPAQILPSLHATPASGVTSGESSASAAKQQKLISAILGDSSPAAGSSTSSGQPSLTQNIPHGFPALPSRHTYRAEVVYPTREQDPQQIRELATNEGRLGEEALRRLAAKQAELRHAREQRELREQRLSALARSEENERERASSKNTSGAVSGAALKRKASAQPAFRAHADSLFRGLMAGGLGDLDGISSGSNGDGGRANGTGGDGSAEQTAPRPSADAGGDVGQAEPGSESADDPLAANPNSATPSHDRDRSGGLNEPINAERIYWRQAAPPSKRTTNGDGTAAGPLSADENGT